MVETSLYIHVPFCTHKCGYCHFFVLPDKQELKKKYLRALELEWQLRQETFKDKTIVSVYFGGGTPTLLDPEQIATILSWIKEMSPDCEISLEANPESTSLEQMQRLKMAGVNRVSLGVQSLNDSLLVTLDRRHGAAVAKRAVETIYCSGIDNISIDLMYDLPGQTLLSFEATLQEAIALPIKHLSLYNLTIEPGTAFFKNKQVLLPSLPSDETSLLMLNRAVALLQNGGFMRYEISAFARNGAHSRHNRGYWQGRPFLGLGPSAFSYWNKKRLRNVANLNRYAEALEKGELPIDFQEELLYPDNLHELLAIGIRLLEGVDLNEFESKWGALPESTLKILETLALDDYIRFQEKRITLTEKGTLFYDTVAASII